MTSCCCGEGEGDVALSHQGGVIGLLLMLRLLREGIATFYVSRKVSHWENVMLGEYSVG